MDFIINDLLDNEEIKNNIGIISLEETKKVFSWLDNNFNFQYGQINLEKVDNSVTTSIDGMDNNDISDLLTDIIKPTQRFIAVWSDIDQGIKIDGNLILKYH